MKVFGIGLSKTATNSLCDALEVLGLNLLHYPPSNIFDAVDECDGCADLPTVVHYKELDERFPGSKFVLTTREPVSWLHSIAKHFERRPPSTLGEWGAKNRVKVYGSLYPTPADFMEAYDKHHQEVRDYFKHRPDDLIEINITAGSDADLWTKLCHFLNIEQVPDMPFPHGNAAPTKTDSVDAVIPYITDPTGWEELRYSLRALEANFIDLNNVWIVGDKPDWLNDNARVIPHSVQMSIDDTTRNFNYCKSMWMAAKCPDITDEFLYLADDHYILTPRTAQDFRDTIIVRENMASYNQTERLTANRVWQEMIWSTVDKLLMAGLSGWNYETHTPKLVNRRNLMDCFAALGYGDGKLIWQTAYFNMFPPPDGIQGYLSESTTLKAGFYDQKEYEDIKEKADAAIFMNHNDDGLNDALKRYLKERFPDPSKFES